ncbi:hypothetical protein [Brachyspira intermedia]|uniref:hypothetical protein n=1 Tax=Brachyspira intermedia TaxID=84377 RepID=UPI003007D6E2
MCKLWKIFEKECFNYLQDTYTNVKFKHIGASDSTVSDIKVIDNDFFIEVKSAISQCGQFVVLEYNNSFIYSNQNKTYINQYSKYIINYMNKNFDVFYNAGTRGVDININKDIFVSWIIDFYKTKNTKYFITKADNYIIIPLEKIYEYFDITACYRVKKSGSSNPSRKNIDEIVNFLKNNSIKFELEINSKKLYIITEYNFNKKININNYSYQFNNIDKNIYNVRKLSNTNNANVIFSIKLIKNYQEENDLRLFLEDIKL